MTESPQAHESDDHNTAPTGPTRLQRAAGLALLFYWPTLALLTHWPRFPLPERPRFQLEQVLQFDKLCM